MKLDIAGFNVAAIYSNDIEKSLDFYTNILGFEKLADVGGGIQLRLNGDSGLCIYLQGGYPNDTRGYESSKISLCFNTNSTKNTFNKVKELNIPINFEYREIGPSYAMFCALDPSGNQIMFMGQP